MSEMYIARGVIAAKASRIESLLRELGAEGLGFKELTESISSKLDGDDRLFLGRVVSLRNKAAHDDEFTITEKELLIFLTLADDLIWVIDQKTGNPKNSHSISTLKMESDAAIHAFNSMASAKPVDQAAKPTTSQDEQTSSAIHGLDSTSKRPDDNSTSTLGLKAKAEPAQSRISVKVQKSTLKEGLKQGAKRGLILLGTAAVMDILSNKR